MKTKLFFTFAFCLLPFAFSYSQVPLGFNYQAVVRDAQGVIINQDVSLRISILKGIESGPSVYVETHQETTNSFGLITLEIGNGTMISGDLPAIDWSEDSYFIKIELDADGGTNYQFMGTSKLLSVPYALNAGSVTSLKSLNIMEQIGHGVDSALFEVKNLDGNTVFAVYNEGVRVYVNDDPAKGLKGGFAVGGFNSSKGITNEYLRVTPDSVRVYIDETIAKGLKGGFAVGGFNPGKAGSDNIMHLTPDNYFIGHQSGSSITTGLYNSFFGYQSGLLNDIGNRNVFIGYKTGYSNIDGENNIFLGFASGYNNTTAEDNVFIGNWAGYYNTTGTKNVFQGYQAGAYNDTGSYNVFIGNYAGRENTFGNFNTFLGTYSGWHNTEGKSNVAVGQSAGTSNTIGDFNLFVGTHSGSSNTEGTRNTYIGQQAGEKNITGGYNVAVGRFAGNSNETGDSCVFIGNAAGYWETGSNKLYIANSSATSLIYGDFNSKFIAINGELRVNDNNFQLLDNVGSGLSPAYYIYQGMAGSSASLKEYAVGIYDPLWVSGNVWADSYLYNSDKRFKKNIRIIDNSLLKVIGLKGVYYDWEQSYIKGNDEEPTNKKYEHKQEIGFIAQDIEKFLPEVVHTDAAGYKSVDYGKISALLVEAIKEQQKMIEELQERIAVLEEENK